MQNHFAPLAHSTFGQELIESAAASDASSVISGRPGAPRVTALVLTPNGTAPLTSVESGPAVPMLVTTQPHAGPIPGSSVPIQSPTHLTYRRQPLSVRLTAGGSAAGTPDNLSVACECPLHCWLQRPRPINQTSCVAV